VNPFNATKHKIHKTPRDCILWIYLRHDTLLNISTVFALHAILFMCCFIYSFLFVFFVRFSF